MNLKSLNKELFETNTNLLKRCRLLIILLGSLIVSAWTMLRFFVKPSTFDLVGQQLLTRQWLSGLHAGSTVGPTNYILKMIFLYSPLQWTPGSPRLKLVLLTIILNIVTFVLLVLILEKL